MGLLQSYSCQVLRTLLLPSKTHVSLGSQMPDEIPKPTMKHYTPGRNRTCVVLATPPSPPQHQAYHHDSRCHGLNLGVFSTLARHCKGFPYMKGLNVDSDAPLSGASFCLGGFEIASVYTYIYICIHIHACIHTYIHACIHTCIHTYIHTYIPRVTGPY